MGDKIRTDLAKTDKLAPKAPHTAHRIWEWLVDEHGATIAYRTVSKYVAKRRPQIALEARNRASVMDGFVPQTHFPGQDAEVDFAEIWVNVGGIDTKCFLLTLRMSFSGKAIHRVYSSQGQEAFFAGHLAAFTELGGVPAGEIRYRTVPFSSCWSNVSGSVKTHWPAPMHQGTSATMRVTSRPR
ncbi:hypothetical protein [Amycolatopsis speibonae]|uniref:Transposase n=1 Tax=Amycolatopsis speibonae TaxID=1450224 RepID=A0ABV7P0Z9_9PSEU